MRSLRGSHLGLQIFVGERDLVATAEVLWSELVRRRWRDRGCWAFDLLAGVPRVDGDVRHLPLRAGAVLVHRHLTPFIATTLPERT